MKLEQNDKQLLFSETQVPDIFFTDYLPELPGDYLKIYLYLVFLSKYKKDVKINDLSKKLSLPVKAISDGLKFLEDKKLILKKTTGFIVVDLQEVALNNLYKNNRERFVNRILTFEYIAQVLGISLNKFRKLPNLRIRSREIIIKNTIKANRWTRSL